MKIVLIVAGTALAAVAAAGTLPTAGDEHVMRFGPLASGVFEIYKPLRYGAAERLTGGGGGLGFWAQYDRTWIGYAMRLGVAVFEASGTRRSVNWDNEYYFYLCQSKIRPFIMIRAGYGYVSSEISGNENRFPMSLDVGIRSNAPDSPLYYTFGSGIKFVGSADDFEEGFWVVLRGKGYFPLTDTAALYVSLGLEGGNRNFRYEDKIGNDWRVSLDVGPSWAF